ncbi:lipopolysaccharide biosynthesis protein [Streptomyces sp. ms191]|uniref:lipopolysaccharide biosynthesis protein n=1 Tax=unclassified Streptomyces TaxID=2593676 RepID=UPI0011CE50C2|nr:lipopolysaccharide biosynthesis protein [Streptomyces sp. ms191]TXS32269.1 lipopolysaccharide biosynthesis protein [Streptomyces sp. ms191]
MDTAPTTGTEATAASLGTKVRSAARWSLINTMVMRLGNFATGIILARFVLDPAAWGVYGVAQTVLMVLLAANELGVTLAVVRWEGDVRSFAPTVLTLSTISSSLLYLGIFAAAPGVAGLLGSPEASSVLRVMCVCLVLDGLSQVPAGVLTREFAQGRRMVIDALNFALSTSVTLVLALQGWGAMSFACGAVAGNLVALAGCALAAPGYLRFGWNPEQARALLRFGLPLAGASMLSLAVVNADAMVVGAVLGNVSLGFYMLAFNMAGWPVRVISEAARRVSFAGFSRLADSPKALSDGFGRALAMLVTCTVPACVLLGALARPAVELLYGSKWSPAAAALPCLMALGLARIAAELTYDCLVAIGRRRSLVLIQALWLVALVPTLIVAARTGGIASVAAGHVLVAGLVVLPAFVLALRRGGIATRSLARACAWPLLGGIVMTVVVTLLRQRLGEGVLALCATSVIGLVCYALCVLPSRRLIRGSLPRHSRSRGEDGGVVATAPTVPVLPAQQNQPAAPAHER